MNQPKPTSPNYKLTNKPNIAIYSDAVNSLRSPLDVHSSVKKRDAIITKNGLELSSTDATSSGLLASQSDLNLSWLPFCAKTMNISPDIKDYLVVPVITMTSELPNRNGVSFPLKTLTAWNQESGCCAYKTFVGKPTHIEHQNSVIENAKGVILDAFLRKMPEHGNGKLFKLVELLAFDRTKDPDLCKDILSGEMNSYSMGAMVGGYQCSFCGAKAGNCEHIDLANPVDFYEKDGKLVYREVFDILAFETSAVSVPAYLTAISDKVSTMW